jgi:RarD protein
MGKKDPGFTAASLKIVVTMLIFGSIGLIRRNIPYSSAMISFFRGAVAALILFVLRLCGVFGHRSSSAFSASSLGSSAAAASNTTSSADYRTEVRINLLPLAISGAMIGVNWILLFEAYRFTTIAVATISYYMAPVFTVIASVFILKEKLTVKKAVCVLVAVIGMVFVSGVIETGISGLKGVLLGMGAALLYSGDVIINKKVKGVDGIDRTIIQMGFAALAVLPYWLVNEDFSTLMFSLQPMVLLMVTAVVCTALTYSLYFSAIQKVPAQTAAILSYIDPVVAVLISALILHEGMSVLTLVGVVLVIGAALFSETGRSED